VILPKPNHILGVKRSMQQGSSSQAHSTKGLHPIDIRRVAPWKWRDIYSSLDIHHDVLTPEQGRASIAITRQT
jgi:hypothetical protein